MSKPRVSFPRDFVVPVGKAGVILAVKYADGARTEGTYTIPRSVADTLSCCLHDAASGASDLYVTAMSRARMHLALAQKAHPQAARAELRKMLGVNDTCCPFCGSGSFQLGEDHGVYFYACTGCKAEGPTAATIDAAWAYWKRRAA